MMVFFVYYDIFFYIDCFFKKYIFFNVKKVYNIFWVIFVGRLKFINFDYLYLESIFKIYCFLINKVFL